MPGKEISQIKMFCSNIKKGLVPSKQDLLKLQKSICLHIQKTHGKQPLKILTATSQGKFLWQISAVKSRYK